eukprot:NODE_420_length_858_cov_360.848153_g411_i0.p2 GENE.NODE_420_length_858_cov_360.848153_g411_i0~~NODE_420_length_858_cov_360.848153_g411_i0.p2  ORF type:complete len:169 (+),score=34.88 NODE_420_length_858_cov_360.848153_g411_i0:66-572(+)
MYGGPGMGGHGDFGGPGGPGGFYGGLGPYGSQYGNTTHAGRTGSPPKRSISPVRRDPQYMTHDPGSPPYGSKAQASQRYTEGWASQNYYQPAFARYYNDWVGGPGPGGPPGSGFASPYRGGGPGYGPGSGFGSPYRGGPMDYYSGYDGYGGYGGMGPGPGGPGGAGYW